MIGTLDACFEEERIGKCFAERLIRLLKERDISQREFANKIGVSEVAISRYIKGSRSPRLDTLVKVAMELDVSIDYLVGLSEMKGSRNESKLAVEPKLGMSLVEGIEAIQMILGDIRTEILNSGDDGK